MQCYALDLVEPPPDSTFVPQIDYDASDFSETINLNAHDGPSACACVSRIQLNNLQHLQTTNIIDRRFHTSEPIQTPFLVLCGGPKNFSPLILQGSIDDALHNPKTLK